MFNRKKKNTILYMQHNSHLNKRNINSLILECNTDTDYLLSILSNVIKNVNMINEPINFNSLYEGKYTNAELKNNMQSLKNVCSKIDDHNFSGAYIYGGKNGNKYFDNVELNKNEEFTFNEKEDFDVIMNICSIKNGKNECFNDIRIGNISEIRKQRDLIEKIIIKQELEQWNNEKYFLDVKNEVISKLNNINNNK